MIELMIVMAIIGILVAVILPQFTAYRYRGNRADLTANLRNAYTAAQAYLTDSPNGTVTTEAVLTQYGYKRSPSIVFGGANLSMAAGQISLNNQSLPSGSQTGTIDNNGIITLP